ncbi:rRNA methyltransferase [Streptomyces benahoarensis]|uniref:rRNA methyltransferase n=1 Tax=Streptomyces benahoarensis TaxID=2595054 RepID=A0A553ZFN0_9ACTN|nr:rRNA methyltransferase [Streptomyces benahoarensis]TSB21415.1 rRNA methyltransferase [Streptomyces benahoarensis]TSB40248.1 rRNA methyltransferase [Streptomyces benahoarensis]
MAYRYATERVDHSDLASGFVLRSAPGFTAFPVRLASETFQRALTLRGGDEPAVLWDPCCGKGYLSTVVGLVHRDRIAAVVASDIDDASLEIARANLALLTARGLADRAAEQAGKAARFGKPGYTEAAAAAERLAARLAADGGDLPHTVHHADVFDPSALERAAAGFAPDIVVTDVPYGERVQWQGASDTGLPGMLTSLARVLPERGVIAIGIRGRKFPPVPGVASRKFRVGTRSMGLFRVADVRAAASDA